MVRYFLYISQTISRKSRNVEAIAICRPAGAGQEMVQRSKRSKYADELLGGSVIWVSAKARTEASALSPGGCSVAEFALPKLSSGVLYCTTSPTAAKFTP